MTYQSGGAGIPLTQSVAGVLSGSILAPAFATNGTTPILGTVAASLAADFVATNATQWYDVVTLSLTAGSWLILGSVVFSQTNAGFNLWCRLWDGTTIIGEGWSAEAGAGTLQQMTAHGLYVATGPTSFRFSFAGSNGGATVRGSAAGLGTAGKASYATALRIA